MADDSGLRLMLSAALPSSLPPGFAGKGASDRDKVNLLLSNFAACHGKNGPARFRCVHRYRL